MNDYWVLIASFITGAALGIFFFGGLWWTVLKGVQSKRPGLMFSLSMLIRTGVVLAGFVIISQGHIERLALCLLGFFIARGAVMRRTRQTLEKQASGEKEAKT